MKKQRALAMLLAMAMVVGLLPTTALAAKAVAAAATDPGSIVGTYYSNDPNAYEIYPVPQSVTYSSDHSSFTMTDTVNVVAGAGVDSYTTAFLREILTRFGRTMTTSDAMDNTKTNIVLAIHGDSDSLSPAAFTDLFTAGTKYDPYLLKAEDGTITIIGKDADSVYYGVATLQMMFTSFNAEKFLNVTIEDYSETLLRGVVEGFYGDGFGTDAVRATQIEGIRDVKGNMYVFAPKADPYHGKQWDVLYPAEKLNSLKDLVETGKANKVEFAWSVHLGMGRVLGDAGAAISDEEYSARLSKLQAKFQQLYDIGVRNFHILNDDANSGTYERQVQLLNDINRWLKGKGGCGPLVYCCAGYNTAWAGAGAELQALQSLDEDIYLYWTGSNVNSPITPENVNWAQTRSNHKIVTWLNYPCSEHAGSGLFLGNINHYIQDACSGGMENQIGFFSNPIASPEANKVAYFQLLSWAWHREGYTSYQYDLWENCFKYLQPEVYQTYLTIARNVSNCPNSGRIPAGFPESEYIKEWLEAVQTAALNGGNLYSTDAQALAAEFENIHAAIAAFRANCGSSTLKTELEPWLKSLTDAVTASQKAIEAEKALSIGDTDTAWNLFSEGAVALGTWDTYPTSNYNSNYKDKTVKAGSLRIQPFANTLLNHVRDSMAAIFNPGGGLAGGLVPIIKMGGTVQDNDANAQKIVDGDPATYASYPTNQVADDYFGVDLGSVKLVSAVDILQGSSDTHHDYFHKAALEYSTDGEHWDTLVTKVNSHHIRAEDLSIAARYVRLRLLEQGYQGPNGENGGGANYWTYIREFTVTTEEAGLLYTNISGLPGAQTGADGGVYTLSANSLTLGAGEYVGLRLPELTGIQSITGIPDGVTLQHSVSGVTWTEGAPGTTALMGYIRLINNSNSPVTLSGVALTAREPVRTELRYVSSNTAIWTGGWDNVVDGDRSTSVYIGEKQAYGQYSIFDLGGEQPVKDVTIFVPDTGSDIPHNLDFFVGSTPDPNGNWTKIGEIRNDNYVIIAPYKYFSIDAANAFGRYIKLAIADVDAINWYYINELEVNKNVPQEVRLTAVSASSGDPAAAVDGDLLTFFTPEENTSGHWEKLLQSPATFDSVTVLRGPSGATARVMVQKDNAWQSVGSLSSSATTIPLTSCGPITGVRIEWTGGDAPNIAEVLLAGDAIAGETPILYPNIYEKPADPEAVNVPNGTAAVNLPLPDRVEVTTSGGVAAEVPVVWSCSSYDPYTAGVYTFVGEFDLTGVLMSNPGCFTLTAEVTVRDAEAGTLPESTLITESSRVFASGQENSSYIPNNVRTSASYWGSNNMKTANSSSLIDGAAAWIVVDLQGDGSLASVDSITEISVQYASNKAWPTKYVVQAAGDSFNPVDYASINGSKSAVDTAINADTYAGDNAKDASCWTTIAEFGREPSTSTGVKDTLTSAELAAIPKNTRYLRLYFTEINSSALAASSINVGQIIVTGTRTASPNISSVTTKRVSGVVGDEWDSLNIPTHVTAILADGTSVLLPVTWNSTGYDSRSMNEQTFTGTLNLDGSGVTNTGNITATLKVTLSAVPYVIGYTVSPSLVTALYGTAFEQLSLPGSAVLQFSNGTVQSLPITWSGSSYKDPYRVGDQTVEGTVPHPWSGETISVVVQVRLDPILATSVTVDPETLILHANGDDNTCWLEAQVGSENATDKTVVWRSDNPHVAAVSDQGLVTAIGTGTANIYATTHDGSLITGTCQVTVKWNLEGSVTVSGGPQVGSTLSADLNSFVQDAKQSIGIQWYRRGAGDYDFSPIPGATEKEYTVPAIADNVGAAYKVAVTGEGLYEGYSESDPISMTKLAGLPLKAVPTYVNVSAPDMTDGAITGLFKGRLYEYKQVANGADDPGEYDWIQFVDNTGDETSLPGDFGSARIDGLGEGNYVVRRAADGLYEAGPHRTVTIAVRDAAVFDVYNPQTFPGGIVTMGRSQIPEGDTARITVEPDSGYELVPGSLMAVTETGEMCIAAPYGADPNSYAFTMPGAAVRIQAQFRLKTYTITHSLSHITCTLGNEYNHTATHGQPLSITLIPDPGYEMRPNTVTIINTETGEPFTDFTYLPDGMNPANRVITFTHGVTCNLTISGQPVLKEYILDCQFEDLTSNAGYKVTHGEALTIQITPANGYILPAAQADIHITMDGADFTNFAYYVNDFYAEIAIEAGMITGDLVITASAATPLVSASILGVARVGEQLTPSVVPSTATIACKWIITAEDGSSEIFTENALIIPASAEGKTITLEVTGTGRYSGTVTTVPTAAIEASLTDKTALRAAYDDGRTVVNDNYTTATWNSFQNALSNAEAVLNDGGASQAQIDEALAVLTAARAALEKQSTSPSYPPESTPFPFYPPESDPLPSAPATGNDTPSPPPSPTTTTQVKEDGTRVTTVTNPDGSKTESTEFPDGTKSVVETTSDGSKTKTVERPNGTKSETVTTRDGAVTITVTDKNGEELVNANIPAAIPEPAIRFEDVDTTPWAEEAICRIAGLGLVNGTGSNKYSPTDPMTRGSLASILHRLSQCKTNYESTFKDVAQGQYYAEGVAWAAKSGVVTGYSDEIFAPDDSITREQLATMIVRYANLVGLDTRADVKSLDSFADGSTTSTWAADSVAWCVENGILMGKDQNNLDPTANVTRAEVAVMLDRFIALLK